MSIYCGINKPRKNQRRGTAKQCLENGQVRYYGIEEVPYHLLGKKRPAHFSQKEWTLIQDAMKRKLNIEKELKKLEEFEQDEEIEEEIEELEDEEEEIDELLKIALEGSPEHDEIVGDDIFAEPRLDVLEMIDVEEAEREAEELEEEEQMRLIDELQAQERNKRMYQRVPRKRLSSKQREKYLRSKFRY
jgi:hypothetical protein